MREAQALGHGQSSVEEEHGLAAPVGDGVQVLHRLEDQDDVVGQPADAEDQGDEEGQPDGPLARVAPPTPQQRHRHGAVAVAHDRQRQEETRVLQESNGQHPVVRVDSEIPEGAGGEGAVIVLSRGVEHQIGHR